MKIYRRRFYDADEGLLLAWHSSKKSAERELRAMQKKRGVEAMGPEGVSEIEIPTSKIGLLNWLNAYFVTDNG